MRRPLVSRSLFALVAPLAAQLVVGLSVVRAEDAADAGAAENTVDAASSAEPEPAEAEEPAGAKEGEQGKSEAPAASEGPSPVLEPPSLAPLELDAKATGPTQAATEAKPAAAPAKKGWTAPETIFQLHGYLRLRAGLLKNGALGHTGQFDRLQNPVSLDKTNTNYDPFSYFTPYDAQGVSTTTGDMNGTSPPVAGGCHSSPSSSAGACPKKSQVGGDMRFRLKPEIHLSDDIRVKAWVDVMDNVGLGTLGYGASYRPVNPDLGNAIRVRRAWGEARNRDIGELRFGRMGADWGLGILDNGGDRNGIDSDFSSDVDRIMGMTNLAGFYFMAAYDWASQGKLLPGNSSPSGVPLDRAQRDDFSAVTASIAHKLDADVQRASLLRGEKVFNYGVYFVWRKQLLKYQPNWPATKDPEATADAPFSRLNQKQYIPDFWAQFLWEGLRVELEATYVAGSIEGGCPRILTDGSASGIRAGAESTGVTGGQCKLRQFGLALEAEYRLFDDHLGIFFLSGMASGDRNSYGLAQTNDPNYQLTDSSQHAGNRTISTFGFHPDYRIDLILWRTLMRRVAGAYYFKPGVSYDFIHDPYGQQAGARLDVIYSRAMAEKQTWGHDANLGLELDLSLYYRSEDGPDIWDGFYGLVQFGILFPFKGLGYSSDYLDTPKTKNAIVFRGVTGIQF